ncbi:MAG: ESPR-type extended signal peptide-containing protein [Pelistega sp.]|nr:ESPR-type extended signal peptide-containing protein [Pelistega sp.]
MNAIYRSIYNESLGTWVAVPEFTAAKGKQNSVKLSTSRSGSVQFVLTALASGLILALGGQAMAEPVLYARDTTQCISLVGGAAGTACPPASTLAGGSILLSSNGTGHAAGAKSIAIGSSAQTTGTGSIAIGLNAKTGAAAAYTSGAYTFAAVGDLASLSIGTNAEAYGTFGVALGHYAGSGSKGNYMINIGSQAGKNGEGLGDINIGFETGINQKSSPTKNGIFPGDPYAGGNVNIGTKSGQNRIGDANVAVGIGSGRTQQGDYNVSIGILSGLQAKGIGNTFVGSSSGRDSIGEFNVGIGNFANGSVTADRTIAIGYNPSAQADFGIAMGLRSVAGVAGDKSKQGDIALGSGAQATGGQSIALGAATSVGKYVTGTQTTASGAKSIALGSEAKSSAEKAIAIGTGSQAKAVDAIAIGTGNIVTGEGSVAIGDPSLVDSKGSFSAGNNNAIGLGSDNSFTLGGQNSIGATATRDANGVIDNTKALTVTTAAPNTSIVGFKNTVESPNVMVMGNNVTVGTGHDGAVVLGNNSTVGAAVPTANASVGDVSAGTQIIFGDFAGAEPKAGDVVSVGAFDKPRQIQNVAAGRISATSTDAINGSQLHATNVKVAKNITDIANINTQIDGAKTHYYSVKSTNKAVGSNYNNDGAKGANALAAGVNVKANGENSLSAGYSTEAASTSSIALGDKAIAGDKQAIDAEHAKITAANAAIAALDTTSATYAQDKKVQDNIIKAATTEIKLNSTEAIAIGLRAKAKGKTSIALGSDASVSATDDGIAIGHEAQSTGLRTVAIGYKTGSGSTGDRNTFVGSLSTGLDAKGDNNSLFGTNAGVNLKGNFNTAMGSHAAILTKGSENIAVGFYAGHNLVGDQNIGIGHQSGQSIVGLKNIALGSKASFRAEGDNNIAIGELAGTEGEGVTTHATMSEAISIGKKALASADQAIALGSEAKSSAAKAIAIGTGSQAKAVNAIAIGTGNIVTGEGSVAIGDPSLVDGKGSFSAGNNNAIGTGSDNSFTLGGQNSIGATATRDTNGVIDNTKPLEETTASPNTSIVGFKNTVESPNVMVMGNNVIVGTGLDGAVVLGNNSTVGAAVPTANASVGDVSAGTQIIFGDFAGAEPKAGDVVSVGSVDKPRQIHNVAAGRISATSTDAINGSQLFMTNAVLGNVANSVVTAIGGNTTINNDGTIVTNNIGGTNQTTIHGAIESLNQQLAGSSIHFYSVGSTDATKGNYDNKGATGTNALAAGVSASATGGSGVAVGTAAQSHGVSSVALGSSAFGGTSGSIAIGSAAKAGLGSNYEALDWINSQSSIMGYAYNFATASDLEAYVATIANKTKRTTAEEFVYRSVTGHANNVAIGQGAMATGSRNISIGENSGGFTNSISTTGVQDRTGANFNNFGIHNINIGSNAGTNNQNADKSVNLGYQAGFIHPTAKSALDEQAKVAWNDRAASTNIGSGAGYNSAAFGNIAVGTSAGAGIVDLNNNAGVFVGPNAGQNSKSGVVSTADSGNPALPFQLREDGRLASPGSPIIAGANTAIGPQALRSSTGSTNTAVGRYAMQQADGSSNTAIGVDSLLAVKGDLNVGVGTGAGRQIEAFRSTSVGAGSMAYGNTAVALGSRAVAGVHKENTVIMSGVAVGYEAKAIADSSIALGKRASASVDDKDADSSIAIGSNATAKGKGSIALGGATDVTTELLKNSVSHTAEGYGDHKDTLIPAATMNPVANADFGIALGTASVAGAAKTDVNAIAVGKGSQALAKDAIAIGTGNIVTGEGSVAIGDPSLIDGKGSFSAGNNNAIGTGSDNSFTLGAQNSIGATATRDANGVIDNTKPLVVTTASPNTSIVGFKNTVESPNVMVMGNNVTVGTGLDGAVVLGNNSTVTKATPTASATIGTGATAVTFGGFAGVNPADGDVVSVGSADAPRQIQNVAAGQISATSTDAINGSQLFATNQQVAENTTNINNINTNIAGGFGLSDDAGNSFMLNLGKAAPVIGDGSIATSVVDTATGKALQVSLSENINVGKDGVDGKDGTIGVHGKDGSSVVINGKDGSIGLKGTDGKDGLTLKPDAIVFHGVDGVNGKDASVTVATGQPGLDGKDGITRIQYIDPDGTNHEVATLDDGLKFEGNQGPIIAKKLNQTLAVKGGLANTKAASSENIRVDSEGGELVVKLSKDLTGLNSITLGDNITNQTVINQGSVTTNNLTVTGETKLGDNFHVTNAGDVTYNGPITGDTHIVNKKYVDNITNAGSGGGFGLSDDAGNSFMLDLGKAAPVIGDGSIATSVVDTATGKALQVSLSENINVGKDGVDGKDGTIGVHGKDGSSVVINGKDGSIGLKGTDGKDGLTLKPDAIVFHGVDGVNGKDASVTVATGQPGLDGKDGITRIQYIDPDGTNHEVATLDDGLKFEGNQGPIIAKKLNQTLAVKGGLANTKAASSENIRVDSEGGELVVKLSKDLTGLNSITLGDNITNQTVINQGSVTTNNLTVTGETKLGDNFHVTNAGDVTYNGPITGDTHIVNKKYVDNITNAGSGGGFGLSDDAGNSFMLNLGKAAPVIGDGSIATSVVDTATGKALKLSLSSDLTVGKAGKDGKDGTIGVHGKDGSSVVINGKDGSIGANGADGKHGVSINGKDGSIGLTGPAGTTTIKTQDGSPGLDGAPGTTTTRIVYEKPDGTTEEVATLNDGLKFEGNQGPTIAKKLNQTLAVKGGLANDKAASSENLRVDSEGGELIVKMAEDIKAGSITINNGGPVINNAGINMNDNRITNLGDAINQGDAVNLKQLTEVKNMFTEGDANSVKYDSADKTTITLGGVNATTTTKITNLTAGDLSATSTDAVNGSQLYATNQKVDQNTQNISNINTQLDKGLTFAGNEGSVKAKLGETVNVVGGAARAESTYSTTNVTTVASGNTVEVRMADSPKFTGEVKAEGGVSIHDHLTVNPGTTVNMGGNQITNVGAGTADDHAATVGQVKNMVQNINNGYGDLSRTIEKNRRDANAGTAAAMAIAGLGQPYQAGQNMVSLGTGVWRGETGYALGVSGITDNGKWLLKGAVTGSGRGGVGGSASINYVW